MLRSNACDVYLIAVIGNSINNFNRQIYQEIPPRVEYTLTELAESFVPILEQMKEWSETHLC